MRIRALFFVTALLLSALASWRGMADEIDFGRFHALVIGNNEYRSLPKLQTAVNDAQAIARLLKIRYGYDVRLLLNATRTDILRALNDYRAELAPEDNLLVYYAGHGWLDRQTNTGFWQPVDAASDDDLNWIANEDLTRRFSAMAARHVMVIADSCYSGTLVRSSASSLPTAVERQAWLARMAEKRSRTAIVSGGLEPVADSGRGGHSVFANALLTALEENDGVIDDQALFRKISRPVVVNADQTPEFSDIRKAGHEGGAFLFVARDAGSNVPQQARQVRRGPDPGQARADRETVFWQSIQNSRDPADFEAYLKQYPDGSFAVLARNRLQDLRPEVAAVPKSGNVNRRVETRRPSDEGRKQNARTAPASANPPAGATPQRNPSKFSVRRLTNFANSVAQYQALAEFCSERSGASASRTYLDIVRQNVPGQVDEVGRALNQRLDKHRRNVAKVYGRKKQCPDVYLQRARKNYEGILAKLK
jgi:uncharacterized caspase-like protein